MLAYLILISPILFAKNLQKYKAHSATSYVVSVKSLLCFNLWKCNLLLLIKYN